MEKKYSNTQGKIGKEFNFIDKKIGEYLLTTNELNKITNILGPPPENNSSITKNELKNLIYYNNINYHQNFINQVNDEKHSMGIINTFEKHLKKVHNKYKIMLISLFIKLKLNEVNKYLYATKKYFDRVRPEFLINNFKPLIETPTHPAYPSGHATQTMYVALLLGYFDSKNLKIYIDASKEISVNREKVGLHYQSDTFAGYKLAVYLANKYIGYKYYEL
jgi:hypothetical protein